MSKDKKYFVKRILTSKSEKNGKITYRYKYVDSNGINITKSFQDYAKSLNIPHNIDQNSVIIYPNDRKLLVTYKDLKGRSMYRYSDSFLSKNKTEKFSRTKTLLKNEHKLVQSIKNQIGIDSKSEQAALILYIIYTTGLRIGSNQNTKANVKAYGVSTLKGKHIKLLPNNKIKLDFIGKKGVRNTSIISDPIIVSKLKQLKSSQWSDDIFNVSDSYVRDFLSSLDKRFLIKDLRTLKANKIALDAIKKRKGPAPNEKTFKKWQKEVASKVAKTLGNTKVVALRDYIDPNVWEPWSPK